MVHLTLQLLNHRAILFDNFLILMSLFLEHCLLSLMDDSLWINYEVLSHSILDLACSLGVFESVKGLLIVRVELTNTG